VLPTTSFISHFQFFYSSIENPKSKIQNPTDTSLKKECNCRRVLPTTSFITHFQFCNSSIENLKSKIENSTDPSFKKEWNCRSVLPTTSFISHFQFFNSSIENLNDYWYHFKKECNCRPVNPTTSFISHFQFFNRKSKIQNPKPSDCWLMTADDRNLDRKFSAPSSFRNTVEAPPVLFHH